jgi:hypothetical protein
MTETNEKSRLERELPLAIVVVLCLYIVVNTLRINDEAIVFVLGWLPDAELARQILAHPAD